MIDKVNQEFWGRTAERYDESLVYVVGQDVIDAELAKLREEKDLGRLVEFGCGTGLFTGAVAENADYVLAMDVSAEMIELAAGRLAGLENIETRTGGCYDTGLPEETFDTGLIVNTIHLLESPEGALWEFRTILKPGGKLIITTFTGCYISPEEKEALANRFFEKFGKPPYARNFTLETLEEIVRGVGFDVEESMLIGTNVRALYMKAVKPGS